MSDTECATGPRQEHFRMFALYNRWANGMIYKAAAELPLGEASAARGAFFSSVVGTLNHLLVTDRIWLSRLHGVPSGHRKVDELVEVDLDLLRTARQEGDRRLISFVFGSQENEMPRLLNYTTTAGTAQVQPIHHVLAHIFNHQTHHRGQTHDLICQIAGKDKAPVLDLLAYQRFAAATDRP